MGLVDRGERFNRFQFQDNSAGHQDVQALFPRERVLVLTRHGRPRGKRVNGHTACHSRTTPASSGSAYGRIVKASSDILGSPSGLGETAPREPRPVQATRTATTRSRR